MPSPISGIHLIYLPLRVPAPSRYLLGWGSPRTRCTSHFRSFGIPASRLPRRARPARLRTLMEAARLTSFYSGRGATRPADDALFALPVVELDDFRTRRHEFHNPAFRPAEPAAFLYPLPTVPRTAVLRAGLSVLPPSRVFPRGWTEAAAHYAPEAIASALAPLRFMARQALQGRIRIPPCAMPS